MPVTPTNTGKCITNHISQAVTLLSLACVKLQNTASDLGKNYQKKAKMHTQVLREAQQKQCAV